MTYTHYTSNGGMVDDWNFLNLHGATGVGQYHSNWARIEAEWFMSATDTEKVQIDMAHNNESFAMAFWNSSSALVFPNVANLPDTATLTLSFAIGAGGGSMSVFAVADDMPGVSADTDAPGAAVSPHAPVLGKCIVVTGVTTCPFKLTKSGASGLVFRYEPAAEDEVGAMALALGGGHISEVLVALDWWSLH